MHRVGVLHGFGHDRVSRLMEGDNLLLLRVHDPVLLLQSSDHPVDGLIEFRRPDGLLIFPGSQKGGLVHEVREVGPHEAGRKARDLAEIDIGAQKHVSGMDLQDGFPSVYVRDGRPATCRSNLPGRKSAGSRISGRFVAAMMITPLFDSKPSISTRSWLSVCSRSSLPPKTFIPLAFPNASSSSMKMMQGAWPAAWEKRSRTRDAPTPTNISTNSDPLMLKKGHLCLPGHGFCEEGLARPRRAHQKHPFGDPPAQLLKFLRALQELHDFLELFLGLINPRDIGEGDLRLTLREELGLALGERHDPLPRPHLFHGKPPDQEHDAEREDPDQNTSEEFAS